MTVGLRLGHDLRTDVTACPRLVVDDHLLAKGRLQLWSEGACQHVGDAAGWERRHDAHRLVG